MGILYSSSSSKIASQMFNNSISFNEIKKIMQANNIYERDDIELYNKFNRFGFLNPYTQLGTTREYIFITKPDLHLFKDGDSSVLNPELKGDPFFEFCMVAYPNVMKQLQKSYNGNSSPFINLISNCVRSELDLPSIEAEEVETSSTYQGFNITYRDDSYASDFNGDFSLEFLDSKYLEVFMLFKIYDEYQRLKKDGVVTPPSSSTDEYDISSYTLKRELHDQSAAYKFIVDDDGFSIIHFSKIYGVFPKSVPRDIFGNIGSTNDGLKFSINFNGGLVRDMRPEIIRDFNALVGFSKSNASIKNSSKDISLYNKEIQGMNGEWCSTPYINTYDIDNWSSKPKTIAPVPRYELRWRG